MKQARWSGCGLSALPSPAPSPEDPMSDLRANLYVPLAALSVVAILGCCSLSPTPRERLQGGGRGTGGGKSPWEKAQWTLQRITLDEAEVEEELQSIMDCALYSKGEPTLYALLGCREARNYHHHLHRHHNPNPNSNSNPDLRTLSPHPPR